MDLTLCGAGVSSPLKFISWCYWWYEI